MAQTLHQLIDALASNLQKVSQQRDLAANESAKLKAEIDSLRERNKELQSEIKHLEQENEFLALSHRLADTPDTLVESRRLIARLIRTIDVCIAQLKE